MFGFRRRKRLRELAQEIFDNIARVVTFPDTVEWNEVDIELAKDNELLHRWLENQICIGDEYPETQGGTYRALRENNDLIGPEIEKRGLQRPAIPKSIHGAWVE